MPATVPYDPSLVLGSVVEPSILQNLLARSVATAPIDAAQEKMNSLIAMKRSIDMTVKELVNMDVDPSELNKSSKDLKKEISDAAANYIKIKINQEKILEGLKDKAVPVHSNVESPINYNTTDFKKLPLAADSLKMDCQYFSFDENKQSADNQVSRITSYVGGAVSFLGNSASSAASGSAVNQISQQRESHEISGTLVITVTCTHKNALILAPFILDVDKAIRVWNKFYQDSPLKVDDPTNLMKIAQEEGTKEEKFLNIISGASFGSCFIGMVHILNKSSTTTSQKMNSLVANMQEKAEKGMWFGKVSGKVGLDASFSNDIKNMLSSQEVTSHVNLISMGVIPSIKSKELATAVKTFAAFDPSTMMANLSKLQGSTSTDSKTFSSQVAEAEGESKAIALQSANTESIMLTLGKTEEQKNQVLNINSMMEAFEDYIQKASAGESGIPINYYLKGISKAQLAQMWVAKYFPQKYLSISGDDSPAQSSNKS